MSRFEHLPEFDREFKRLSKKYRSLPDDLVRLEKLISATPLGVGTNFVVLHSNNTFKVVKTRLACQSLRERSMRLIYAYHGDEIRFVHIQIYFKGESENEDRELIRKYVEDNKRR